MLDLVHLILVGWFMQSADSMVGLWVSGCTPTINNAWSWILSFCWIFRLWSVTVKYFSKNIYFLEILFLRKKNVFKLFGCLKICFTENQFWCLVRSSGAVLRSTIGAVRSSDWSLVCGCRQSLFFLSLCDLGSLSLLFTWVFFFLWLSLSFARTTENV